jgi:cytosine/adenosine deaminase-related metal-dependent hydrolase
MLIISAPWVVPIDRPVIQDGSVVVKDDLIIDLGSRSDIVDRYPQSSEIFYPCVLMPGLVNAHMHLELSYLQDTVKPQPNQRFTEWIDALIVERATKNNSREKIIEAFTVALHNQYRSGIALIGDIGNEYFDELHCCESRAQPQVVRLLEYLAPNSDACRISVENLEKLDDEIIATGHAPYSTAPELLRKLKKRCNLLQHIFSIHTAESEDEVNFLRTGRGCFRDFLEKKNSWDGTFPFSELRFPGTVDYFDYLEILDHNTLLVHCVHISETELQLIKERGAAICLCPGSNQFLGVGSAPVERMVELGIMPALGTDSPASNHTIDMWREMQILTKDRPNLDRSTILAMATIGGAKALRHDCFLGSITTGKKAKFIHVSSANLKCCRDAEQLVKELVSGGKPTEIKWVSTDHV